MRDHERLEREMKEQERDNMLFDKADNTKIRKELENKYRNDL